MYFQQLGFKYLLHYKEIIRSFKKKVVQVI